MGGAARVVASQLLVVAADAPDWAGPAMLAVNLSGSLLAGFLRGLLEREQAACRDAEVLDALLLVGFCGGYTSYSGFVSLAADGGAAITATTLVLCPLAALAGMRLSGGYPAQSAGNPR